MQQTGNIRPNCLNFWELLALAIALISPTMTAALIVPLMFATSGSASWLAYAFAALMLVFVALSLNQFAKRSSGTGSMYTYVLQGLGGSGGTFAGWALMWAYMFIGTAGMTGFAIFAAQLCKFAGFDLSPVVAFAICAALSFYLAYKDIQLSTILLLVLEGLSVALIALLMMITLHGTGLIDTAQLTLKGASISTLGLGVVVAIFSLVGFECVTAFGREAHNPLKSIPAAMYTSLAFTGLFFVVVSYVEVFALRSNTPTLDKLDAPLVTLSTLMHVGYLKIPLVAGAMLSFFSLAASCLNSGARVAFAMGRRGVLHPNMGLAHPTLGTPYIAIGMYAVLLFVIPSMMIVSHVAVLDAFNFAGTLGAFGFLGAYFLVSIAAPFYLKSIGALRPADVVISALAVLFMLVPAVGSVYPVPAPPTDKFVYVFVAYLLLGYVLSHAFSLGASQIGIGRHEGEFEEAAA
mgnify:CR=1 FL=1